MSEAPVKQVQTRQGPMFVLAHDRFITRGLEAYGELSPDERDMLLQMVRPGLPVVEVGANIGVHTLPLARACAPAPLFAFEPQQQVFQLLCANLATNNIGNVIALPYACGAAEGTAAVPPVNYEAEGNFGGVALSPEPAAGGTTVRVQTIDGLGLPACGLIKIDVEGWEADVLRGAAETIRRSRPRIYLENDRRDRQAEVIGLLDEFGYRLYWHLPRLARAEPNVFGRRLVSVNMVAVPKESATEVRKLEPVDPANWRHPLDPSD